MAISDSFVAVIPAAGKGQRLGGIKPKQYLELGGITILEASTKYILKEKISFILEPIKLIIVSVKFYLQGKWVKQELLRKLALDSMV